MKDSSWSRSGCTHFTSKSSVRSRSCSPSKRTSRSPDRLQPASWVQGWNCLSRPLLWPFRASTSSFLSLQITTLPSQWPAASSRCREEKSQDMVRPGGSWPQQKAAIQQLRWKSKRKRLRWRSQPRAMLRCGKCGFFSASLISTISSVESLTARSQLHPSPNTTVTTFPDRSPSSTQASISSLPAPHTPACRHLTCYSFNYYPISALSSASSPVRREITIAETNLGVRLPKTRKTEQQKREFSRRGLPATWQRASLRICKGGAATWVSGSEDILCLACRMVERLACSFVVSCFIRFEPVFAPCPILAIRANSSRCLDDLRWAGAMCILCLDQCLRFALIMKKKPVPLSTVREKLLDKIEVIAQLCQSEASRDEQLSRTPVKARVSSLLSTIEEENLREFLKREDNRKAGSLAPISNQRLRKSLHGTVARLESQSRERYRHSLTSLTKLKISGSYKQIEEELDKFRRRKLSLWSKIDSLQSEVDKAMTRR